MFKRNRRQAAVMPALLTVVAALLILNLTVIAASSASAEPLGPKKAERSAVGITVVPHPEGQLPVVYRLWSDGTVEYSTGLGNRRQQFRELMR